MNPIIKVLIAVILIYILIRALSKISKWVLRIVIIILIVGIFVFGYTSVTEFWESDIIEKEPLENITIEEPELDSPNLEDELLLEEEELMLEEELLLEEDMLIEETEPVLDENETNLEN